MSARGRPDATGRSSGIIPGRKGKLNKPPRGQAWVWLTQELLQSDAWRALSVNARRFVDFLLLDHMAHGGTENGGLMATHEQLAAFGISKGRISAAIMEAQRSGLVDARRAHRMPTVFALTFFALKDGSPPTNRWKRTEGQSKAKRTPPVLTPTFGGQEPPLSGVKALPSVHTNGGNPPNEMLPQTPTFGGPSISTGGTAQRDNGDSDTENRPSSPRAKFSRHVCGDAAVAEKLGKAKLNQQERITLMALQDLGCDLDRDILPAIEAGLTENGADLAAHSRAIREARDKRLMDGAAFDAKLGSSE